MFVRIYVIMLYLLDNEQGCDSADSSSESDANDIIIHSSDEEEGSELPVYLWRPGESSQPMGEWEQHTRVGYCLCECWV